MSWKDKKNKLFSALQFLTIYVPKIQNLKPMTILNFSIRNIIAIDQLDESDKKFKKKKHKKWHRHTETHTQTDGHRDLETESAQWADSVKINVSLSTSRLLESWILETSRRPEAQALPNATPPIRKISPFRKTALSFEPMHCNFNLECPKPVQYSLFYDWQHHFRLLGFLAP